MEAVRDLPGWPTHWLWGNLHQLTVDEFCMKATIDDVSTNRYKITRGWIGPFFPRVNIHHCDLVRKVINKAPKDDELYRLLKPWLGDGLLISQGKKWFRNRRLLTPAFHYEILKPYVEVYNSCLKIMLEKWMASETKKEPVEVFETVKMLSLDIIMRCVFSFESKCQQEGGREHPYIQVVCDLVELTSSRFVTPHHRVDWIYYFSANGRKYRKACKVAHEYSENVIKGRRDALKLNEGSNKRRYLDFLDILLTAADEDGNGLTDLEIRDEVDTFMFEGHDTTTSGMSWTLYCLAKYPEHQEKVREEVRNVLMGREWLEYDDLKDLKYTQWCIKEAMRLYPPVFYIARRASCDLELDGHIIPKGMNIDIPICIIHRHPDMWENPNVYDPLRFHPDNVEGRDPYAYIPFSAGQRNCIGQNFALNEEKLVIASIVHRFKLSLVKGHKVEMCPMVVLRPKYDILINLTSL